MFGFDEMFDFDGGGELDTMEQMVKFHFIDEMIREEEKDSDEWDSDDDE